MTPDDVAAIRAHYWVSPVECRALCDALEAAWAERDRWEGSARIFCQNSDYWRERAERAEAQYGGEIVR